MLGINWISGVFLVSVVQYFELKECISFRSNLGKWFNILFFLTEEMKITCISQCKVRTPSHIHQKYLLDWRGTKDVHQIELITPCDVLLDGQTYVNSQYTGFHLLLMYEWWNVKYWSTFSACYDYLKQSNLNSCVASFSDRDNEIRNQKPLKKRMCVRFLCWNRIVMWTNLINITKIATHQKGKTETVKIIPCIHI